VTRDEEEAPVAASAPTAPERRGLIGPFTASQLGVAAAVVIVAAVGLFVLTRPIVSTGAGGLPTPLPQATPYLVGEAKEGLRLGDFAPELTWMTDDGATATLTDLDGNPVTLEALRGKLVWLNFWASWCPPCQGETPVLRDLDERYRDEGLVIVGVAVQETAPDVVKTYVERYGLAYPIGFDATAKVFDAYKVFALPTQYFIGSDGRILGVVNGPLDEARGAALIERWLPDGATGG
jgi:thiol-disulfide isomerase/thioredoxin